jgi:hypothetical protein
MTAIPGCGKGGWTLVMKTDGDKVFDLEITITETKDKTG